ncbi:MYPU_1760 family metalloprotease [Mycoplasmopsis gallopavonis]|uniref:Lipoprotein n=1 Tax=Mycoplasmopsis gallopavonis TaxID=76629 RepID=A0A449AZ88_9BACT|nr:hypothetical protein [Mycoplasmopsis gallopavonis]RIV16967.1 hypothetical protein D1113_00275 [Mycoplasmopsis gallopavonis]VEU72785.1 Uncharacterised protein [Mycoplasmopsis gallopavonis]
MKRKNKWIKLTTLLTFGALAPLNLTSCFDFDDVIIKEEKRESHKIENQEKIKVPDSANSNLNVELQNLNFPNLEVTTNSGEFKQNIYTYQKTNKATEGLLMPIVDEREQPTNYNLNLLPIRKSEFSSLELSNEDLAKLNQVGELPKLITDSKTKQRFYQYQDPYTGIIFRDYEFLVPDSEQKDFLFGPQGLQILAQEFKRKVPFGPEVYDLQAININAPLGLSKNFHGLYTQEIKTIYINGDEYKNTNASLYDKVALLMPTIFHEYMHHWASSYVSVAPKFNGMNEQSLVNKIEPSVLKPFPVIYQPDPLSENGNIETWNRDFANNFIKLLNYDFNKKVVLPENLFELFEISEQDQTKFIFENFTLAQLWKIANFETKPQFNEKELNNRYYIDALKNYSNKLNDIFYYYSMTELVPREYTKYAYESYYNINERRTNLITNGQNYLVSSWFGSYSFSNTNKIVTSFNPSSNNIDWSRTYLNGLSNPNRAGNFIQNATYYPNNIFEIRDFKYQNPDNEIQNLEETRSKNRSVEFYQTFLKAMGYGRTISNFSKVQNSQNHETFRFSGYLPNKTYSGFALKNQSGKIYKTIGLKYNSIFNFFGHYDFDQGARLFNQQNNDPTNERLTQINNRLYPKNKYFSYTTNDFFDVVDESVIYLWKDLNNDGKAQENELDKQTPITLPQARFASSIRQHQNGSDLVALYNEQKPSEVIIHHVE